MFYPNFQPAFPKSFGSGFKPGFVYGSSIPRTDLLAYLKGDTVTIDETDYLRDISGQGRHFAFFCYCPTLAGTETLTLAHLTGSETVSSSCGTSTVTVGVGELTFSAGTISEIILSDGTHLIFASRNGGSHTTIYNVDGTGRHGALDSAVDFSTLVNAPYLANNGGRSVYTSETEMVDLASNAGIPAGIDCTLTIDSVNSLTAVAGTTNARVYVNLPTVAGKTYYVTSGSHNNTADIYLYIRADSDGGGTILETEIIDSDGAHDSCVGFTFTATGTETCIALFAISSAGFTASNISCREVINRVYPSPITATYNQFSGKIVCIGDSMTGGNYPLLLQKIYPCAKIIDAGTSSNTVAQMLARFETDVLDQNPDIICYFGAANSIVADVALETIQADISSMISAASSIPFIVGTPTPFGANENWSESRQILTDSLSTWILGLTNVAGKVDLYTTLTDGSDNLLDLYDSGDGLHPNTLGDVAITNAFIAAGLFVDSVFNNFSGVFDAPEDVFVINAPASNAALIAADDDNVFYDVGESVNDVDPADIVRNDNDKIFKGRSGSAFYSSAQTLISRINNILS